MTGSNGEKKMGMSDPAIERGFPGLLLKGYKITSPINALYNCIAWAAGNKNYWWEPTNGAGYYWPPNIPREYTLDAYVQAYQTLGYEECDNYALERGIEKVAILVKNGIPQHATRQLKSGKWTSKLGRNKDISHELSGIEGRSYGQVAVILKRYRNPLKRAVMRYITG